LFSGIGYFTLPFLVHAGAEHVHACEWNPAAIEALKKNLKVKQLSLGVRVLDFLLILSKSPFFSGFSKFIKGYEEFTPYLPCP